MNFKPQYRAHKMHICMYEVYSISFQTFFVWAFKIVIDS